MFGTVTRKRGIRMKRIMMIPIIILLCISLIPLGGLFAQVPDTDDEGMVKEAAMDISLTQKWKLGPSITVPPLILRESTREGAKLDVTFVAGVGGGLAFYYAEIDPVTGNEERLFSFSPFTVLLSGTVSEEANNLDIAYACTVGFFNDLIMTGFGYNLGSSYVQMDDGTNREISRWFWMLGLGVTFNGS